MTMDCGASWVDDVIRFWFDELRPKQWWIADAEVDERIRGRFGRLHARLASDPPTTAGLDARGYLGAVIVLDQFSRNLYRGSPAAFATDELALSVTLDAIERGQDLGLFETQRHILYMPLMHSENPVIQARSLRQFATLADAGAKKSAREHHETIARFGRFPERNEALGRQSTAVELAYLARSRRR